MRLRDRVAIVTGGARGMGKAYVERFAGEGAKVTVADIHVAAAGVTAQHVRDMGGNAVAVACDVNCSGFTGDSFA